MRIGLISDTHGELENLKEAIRQLLDAHRVEKIVHLGDEWEDCQVFQDVTGAEFLVLPGVYASQYKDPSVPNRVIEAVEGWNLLFTHAPEPHVNDLPEDPDPRELAASQRVDVVAYGHTHIPLLEEREHVLWVNPGHLKTEDKKGHPPSYAVLEIFPGELRSRIISLKDQETLAERRFVKRKIMVSAAAVRLRGILNTTETAEKVWDALPVEGKANRWGEEIYFRVPVAAELEDGREVVELGDIGYWPPGQALCFFFGPTPVSRGEEIRPYSPVTVVGRLVDDPKLLQKVKEGDAVKITTFWD